MYSNTPTLRSGSNRPQTHITFNTYTLLEFNYFHSIFSILDTVTGQYVKIIPKNLPSAGNLLTPLALAVWFSDNGSVLGRGFRLATNCFSLDEVILLCKILHDKYALNSKPYSAGPEKGYVVYIHPSSRKAFIDLVRPHMVPSMLYKLGPVDP